MNRSKELTRKTFLITLGRISTQFITFLLLPLYTAFLSTDEYGIVDLITTLVQFIIPVMSLMVDQGVFRYLLNCDNEQDKQKAISSGFFVLFVTTLSTVVIYSVTIVFVDKPYMLWLLLILIITAFSNFFLQVSRGVNYTGVYAFGSFVCSASTIVLNVFCIAFLHMGAVGMLIATFLGNVICCLFLFFKLNIRSYITFKSIKKKIVIDELKYSVPLVPNQLSIWVMNCSDRLIVTFFLGTAANGILAVSHKFPAICMSFFFMFQLAWHEVGTIHFFDEDRDQFFSDLMKKIISIFSIFSMFVVVTLPIVFDWFVNSAFKDAYYYVPIYMFASLFNIVVGVLGVIYVATSRTTEIAKTTIIAAIINISVNFALIKSIGLFAASVSTLIGYMITMIYRIYDSRKYLTIKFDLKQISLLAVSFFICSFIYYLNNKVISLVFFIFFITFAYITNVDTINGVFAMISERLRLSKKILISIVCFALTVVIASGGHFIYKKITVNTKDIHKIYNKYIQTIVPEEVILFSNFGMNDITCTGLTYDSKNESFWIADYGATSIKNKPEPRLIEVDKKFNNTIRVLSISSLFDHGDNLQGVAYDRIYDCLWLALGKNVVAVNKEGQIVKKINMGKYESFLSNGIAYSSDDDTLWVLCSTNYLLHINKNGSVLAEFPFYYLGQDHICIFDGYIYITMGLDYLGKNNFICKVSPQDASIVSLYRTEGANSLEGICNYDGKVFITNDGKYHSDLVGHSYITVYDEKNFK